MPALDLYLSLSVIVLLGWVLSWFEGAAIHASQAKQTDPADLSPLSLPVSLAERDVEAVGDIPHHLPVVSSACVCVPSEDEDREGVLEGRSGLASSVSYEAFET